MNEKIQQLEAAYRHLTTLSDADPAAKLALGNELAWELCDREIDRAYLLTMEIQALLTVHPHHKESAKCAATLGRILARKGHYQEALPVTRKALRLAEIGGYIQLIPPILATLGLIHSHLGNYAAALEYHQRELAIAQEINDQEREGYALNNLALTHNYAGDRARAYHNAQAGLTIFEALQDTPGQALVLKNMALILYQSERHAEAHGIARRAVALSRACGKEQFVLFALEVLGLINTELQTYAEALDYFQEALDLADKRGIRPYKATVRLHMGRVYIRTEQADKARVYLQEAYQLLQETDQKKDLYDCHQLLSETYEYQGDFVQALAHYKSYHRVRSQVFNAETEKKLENLRSFHEIETLKQEAEIHRLKTVELQEALDQVKQLSGLLPICAGCKKIRDDTGYWQQVEIFIRNHSEAEFSHSMCPDCINEYFPPQQRRTKK